MTTETSHAEVTDPNAELADSSQHSIIGMIALVIILILLALAGWSIYDWTPKTSSGTPATPTTAPGK
jgi:hypothetical protein